MHLVSRKQAKNKGLSRYFTGKPCIRGHFSERATVSSNCLTCKKEDWHRMSNEKRQSQLERMRQHYLENDGKKSSRERSRKIREESPDKQAEYTKQWRAENKEKCRLYAREKMRRKRKTPTGKAEDFLRKCLHRCAKDRSKRTEEILGYTRSDLIKHIEAQFSKGMRWDNHGLWHIDHITPISEMLRLGESDPAVVNCLSNLRPLWAKENLSKGAAIEVLL